MFVLSTVPYQQLMIRHLDFFVRPCESQHHSEVDSFVSSVPICLWLQGTPLQLGDCLASPRGGDVKGIS